MTKNSTCNKGKALHISQWIKGELGGRRNGLDGDDRNCGDDEDELELWTAEQMNAKQAEVQRRLLSVSQDVCGSEVVVECTAETISVVSSPDDSQVRILIFTYIYRYYVVKTITSGVAK